MPNVGDKYIIEIESKARLEDFGNCEGQEVYKINFGDDNYRLLLTESEMDKLERYDEDEKANAGFDAGYREGLNDAWEAGLTIYNSPSKELKEIFDCPDMVTFGKIAEKFTAVEAMNRIKTYEKKKKAEEEIRVGDEMEIHVRGRKAKAIAYKISPCGNTNVYFMWDIENMECYTIHEKNAGVKTGRYFPQIAEVLEKMKEG